MSPQRREVSQMEEAMDHCKGDKRQGIGPRVLQED